MTTLDHLLKTAEKTLTGPKPVKKSDSHIIERGVVGIKKTDAELQVVFGEVYAPNSFPDTQNDVATAEVIREAAWGFMRKSATMAVDVGHSEIDCGAYVVESFIARKGDPDFIEGSWVIGVWCPDAEWEMVKKGELNGFSLDGFGIRVPTTIEIEVPDLIKGDTTETDGHVHEFYVRFDENGTFLGGETSPGPDGHVHLIKRGTVTEDANDHSHRFSFVEGVIQANA